MIQNNHVSMRRASQSLGQSISNRPLAAEGLKSYRCRGRYGYIMIGATDDADALLQARRSWDGATADCIEVWNGARYVPTQPA